MGYSSLRDYDPYDGVTLVPDDEANILATLQAEAAGGNSFTNSFRGSRISNERNLLGDEESLLRAAADRQSLEKAALLRARIRSLRDQGEVFATAPSRYEDVHGLGDAASYVAGQLGQAAGSSIDQMATGSAMGLASGIAGLIPHPAAQAIAWGLRGAAPLEMYRQNKNLLTGEAYNEIADDPVAMQRSAQDIRDEVSKHGYRAAVLDTLPQLLPVGQLSGVAGKVLGRMPTSAKLLGEAIGEGLTETGQQYSQQRAHSQLNPERDTSGDMSELINSGLGGAIGGGGMGAVGHYGEKMWSRGRTEGDGKNGDVIDLNAPDEKPKTILEELNGGVSRFSRRTEAEALVQALEGHTEDPAKIPEAAARQKSVLVEELSKLKGKEAEEHLQKVSGIPVDDPLNAIKNLGAPEFLDAAKFVMQKLHITNAELARMKNNAERPDGQQRLSDTFPIPEGSVERWAEAEEVESTPSRVIDPKEFTFDLTPDMFTTGEPEQGVTGKTINERAAANKARLEQAQNKAKLFNTRAELVANKLWNAYTDEHGYEVDAEGALEPSRVRQGDPQAVGIVRGLAQELTAAATVDNPTPAEGRRAERLAEQLVQTVGTKAIDVLTDINRITGSTMALKGIVQAASSYLGATNSSALKVQHDTRDAAAEEFAKLVPADVETQLLAKGINLSSNKDRNDLLDNMEAFSDGKAIFSRMKINALLTKPVVDAMESYLGKTLMPRLEGVRDDPIDENDSYGSKTQATDTEGTHDTEQSAADVRDLTSDEEVSAFDQRQLEKSMDRDSLVFHVSGDKRGSMVKFSDAWKENDDGRLPKLIYPGEGQTQEQTLGHVQQLVAKATERLGPEQRDRYSMGNPASKDPMEAAGATNAKKILDDSGVPDDQRLKLMMRYMEQEGKAEVPGEVAHAISNLNVAERARAYISSVLGKRESLSPSGEKLSIDQNAELNQTRGDLDAVLSVAKKSSKYSELAAIPDLGARMAAMVPIVKSAVETARESLARNIPGYQEFAAKNPNADLKDYVNHFFSQRYAVVAEQPTDRDYLQMNLAELNDMAKKGAAHLNSAWVTAGDDKAEQAKVKAGMNIIHFKSRHSNTGEVAIPAYKLVKWVREQENAHTDDKRENDTGSGSPNAQYDSYLDALKQGITALHMGGLTKGLPWIMNAKGEREEFSPADTKGEPVGGTVDDFGTRWAPTKSSTKTFTDDFGDRVTSLGPDKDYNVGREMSYRKAGKTEVENGWAQAGLGDLPPSLDVGGTSYAEYKRSKAYGAMHKRGAASSEEVHNQGLINAKAEEEKNAELSQDEKDVQGEEAVDEAMAIDQGSRTREEERKHLKLMSSVMRAAADHLPKALTVGAAVNKAGKVAEQLWRDYAANREAGLERIFGYVRSMRRPSTDDSYGYSKELGELWRELHATEAETDEAANVGKVLSDKAAEPKEAGHWGVGGTQYAFPLAALLTPRNIANAHPDDQAMFKHLRSAVAAEIMRAALPDPKTPRLPPVLDVGQVRKLVNFLSGYNDQKKAEKLDEAVKPGGRALLERSKLAPVATSFVPKGGMKRFLRGLVDKNQGVLTVPNLGAKFDGEKRGEKDTMTAVRELGAPKKEPRQVETKEPSEVSPRVSPPLLKTPPKAPGAHQPKETAKLLGADRIIAPISPEGYAGDLGRAAQAEGKRFSPKNDADMTGKVVVVSVPGRGRGFTGVNQIIEHVKMALDRGATVRTDSGANATRAHNAEGEGVLRQALIDGGYTEAYTTDHYSAWQMVGTKEPRQVETKEPSKVAPTAERRANITRDMVRAEPDTLFVFGDNDRRTGLGGQAAAMRGEPNSVGVRTKAAPHMGENAFWSDATFEANKAKIDEDFAKIEAHKGKVVIPADGLGTGRAELATRAPKTLAYLQQKVENLGKHTPSSSIQAPGATKAASDGVGSQNTLGAAISKHQEYLKNPPADYTTERAAAIGTWAAKQLERVRERAKTDQSDELQDMIDSLRRLVKTAEEVTAADKHLEAKLGPQGSVKRNAETIARQTEAESANQFAKLATMAPPKHIEVTSAIKYFERNVSDKVKLILQDVFPDMKGGKADFDTLTNIARISTANPLTIMRLAYHESVHAFFNTILNAKGMEKTKELLHSAMSDPKIYDRVKELLKGEDAALKSMEDDPEERVAYAFQFWKLGLLDIDHAPKTFFEKVQALMRRVFGAVRDSEKALAIFTAFDQGQLKEMSAAGRAIEKIMSQGEWRQKMLAKYDKQAQALYTEVMANHLNFRNSESKTAQLLGRMWYSNPAYGADTEQVKGQDGVINRTRFKRNYYSNRIRVALKPLQGANLKRDLETLAEALNSHTEPTTEILRKAKKNLQGVLTEYRTYAKQAGLDIGEQLGADGKYWPRVYEIEKLINGRESFVNMLLAKHGKLMTTIKAGAIQAGESGIVTERDVAEMIHQSLIDRLGVSDHKLKALREDGVLSPFFASMNERTLEWLADEDVAPYLSKDVIGTMTQYISQGVRAAEYTRTFDEDGIGLKDMLAKKGDVRFISEDGTVIKYEKDGPIRSELATEAENKAVEPSKREEWVERRMEDLKRASGAMEGSLGKDISATARQLQAGAMTYQIVRLLPLMIFSSMLDANGIRVAGGEWEDMFNAYKRGFTGLWNNWKDLFLGNPFGMRDPDDMEKAALASGVINSDMENEEMGEVHSSEYSSGLTRHINHVFFKAIGITQWDRDMRIVATDAARKAIVRDYNNAVPEHSARWLRELGLKKSDIFINDQGQLVVSAAELMKMKKIKDVAVAQKLLEPTHFAVNRWVNRAIVSPNAGLRPTRASDPHFAMFYQFKSFTYAFQETTMRYAMHEAEHGNFSAAARLLHGVPIMIVSDMMKAMVTGGGSMPGYMANWTLVDWISHGINRSGIGGTSSFITDMLGGNVAGTLAGPTVDHIAGVGKDIITGEVGHAVKQSLPVVKQLAGG